MENYITTTNCSTTGAHNVQFGVVLGIRMKRYILLSVEVNTDLPNIIPSHTGFNTYGADVG